eukprot:223780-Chlamydomonas_euryale.AAC.5
MSPLPPRGRHRPAAVRPKLARGTATLTRWLHAPHLRPSATVGAQQQRTAAGHPQVAVSARASPSIKPC